MNLAFLSGHYCRQNNPHRGIVQKPVGKSRQKDIGKYVFFGHCTTRERIMQMTIIGTLNMDRLLEALSVILSNREGAEVKVGIKKE